MGGGGGGRWEVLVVNLEKGIDMVTLLCFFSRVVRISEGENRTFCHTQSMEFVVETRILPEMKTENCRKIYFPWKKIDKHAFFFR